MGGTRGGYGGWCEGVLGVTGGEGGMVGGKGVWWGVRSGVPRGDTDGRIRGSEGGRGAG